MVICYYRMDVPILITFLKPIQLFNSSSFRFIWGTRAVEAQFQIEAPDPYPLLKQRTDLSKPVVLSTSSSVTYIIMWPVCLQLPVPKPTIQINLRITLTPWKERIVKLEVENLTYQITWQVQFLFFFGGGGSIWWISKKHTCNLHTSGWELLDYLAS